MHRDLLKKYHGKCIITEVFEYMIRSVKTIVELAASFALNNSMRLDVGNKKESQRVKL